MKHKIFGFFKGPTFRTFILKTTLLFVVFMLIWSVFYFLIQKPRNNRPVVVSRSSLASKLDEHYLAILALKDIDTIDKSTPYKVEGIRSAVDSTLKNYRESTDRYQDQSNEKIDNPYDFADKEQRILNDYDNRYKALSKVIKYIPASDLASLDPNKDKQEINARIDNAIKALSTTRDSNAFITTGTSADISKFISCYAALKQSAINTQQINNCEKLYINVRAAALKDILSPLNSDQSDQTYKTIRERIIFLRN